MAETAIKKPKKVSVFVDYPPGEDSTKASMEIISVNGKRFCFERGNNHEMDEDLAAELATRRKYQRERYATLKKAEEKTKAAANKAGVQ